MTDDVNSVQKITHSYEGIFPDNHTHVARKGTLVLMINLGSPSTLSTVSIRNFLRRFLSDKRVIEVPAWIWRVILHGFILPFRPAKLLKKYEEIWDPQYGNPFIHVCLEQAKALQSHFDPQLVRVVPAFCYSEPLIEQVLMSDQSALYDRILILPMYPQYSATTTAACNDKVFRVLMQQRWPANVTTINHYHDDPAYIRACVERVKTFWQQLGEPNWQFDHFLMSFHGLPERNLQLGDPYHCHCHKTARLIAQELEIPKGRYHISFQSRFGKAKWLEPYTEQTLRSLAPNCARLDVFCPGFPTDCLETLEEIAITGKELFVKNGGQTFNYISALNTQKLWIDCLSKLVQAHLIN